jgi:hypothetical protein
MTFRVPKALEGLKATVAVSDMGEEGAAPGGVFDHGTHEEDGPETWEAHALPRKKTGATEIR